VNPWPFLIGFALPILGFLIVGLMVWFKDDPEAGGDDVGPVVLDPGAYGGSDGGCG
jgi:hypothetical protein